MAQTFVEKGRRVRLRLRDSHLLSRGEEKRHHFKCELDLTAGHDSLHGLPDWVLTAYTNLVKTGNLAKQQKFTVTLENVMIEMFPTPKGRRLFPIITSATLGTFVMDRTGKGDEDAQVILSFSMYFNGRKDIHDWTYDQKRGDFFAAFEETQGELPLGGEGDSSTQGEVNFDDEDADEDDEEDEEDDEDADEPE